MTPEKINVRFLNHLSCLKFYDASIICLIFTFSLLTNCVNR
jgi:hypothetical protein